MEQSKALILVVDDDTNNQFIIKTMLHKDGYQTIIASNGEEALKILEKQRPDLILLDIMMPKMTGHEVAEIIQKNDRLKNIPILFISTLNDTKNIIQAFDKGAVDFISKPFRKPEVLARIKTHLELNSLREKAKIHANEMEQFAYMAAHDLKSPSNAIKKLSIQLKEGSELDKEEIVYRIAKSSEKLCSLVDGLLQLSEGSKKNYFCKDLDLKEIILEVQKEFERDLIQLNAKLECKLDGTVYSDSTAMKILLTHLISNAIKYSDSSRKLIINITLEQNKDQSILTFQDNGSGLKIDQSNNPFKAFSRFHGMHIEGHGLGLTICKRIIDCHNGDIHLKSALGEGTTIKMTLPRK